jgi:hypothetical protein
MKFISPSDASMIALIAENPKHTRITSQHVSRLGPEARSIADAINGYSHKRAARETAKAVQLWAKSNKSKTELEVSNGG